MNSDNEVLRSIYINYRPVLQIIAARKGIPVDDREDIIQDTFMKFCRYYEPDWCENQIRGMLIKIFNWCYVDSLRRQSCRPITYMDPARIESGEILGLATDKHNPQTMILKAEENQEVVNALNAIKPELSEAIVKLAIEEQSVDKVSEELGISEGTCRTRLSRGRSRMREIIYGKDSDKRKSRDQKKLSINEENTAGPPDSSGLPGSVQNTF